MYIFGDLICIQNVVIHYLKKYIYIHFIIGKQISFTIVYNFIINSFYNNTHVIAELLFDNKIHMYTISITSNGCISVLLTILSTILIPRSFWYTHCTGLLGRTYSVTECSITECLFHSVSKRYYNLAQLFLG